MNAYVFRAAYWCEDCIDAFKSKNPKPKRVCEDDESTYDSDEWPKGPYSNGGGEADYPQHCDGCGVFLRNPLTDDGYKYVADQIQGGGSAIEEWVEFYAGDELDRAIEEWKA